MNQNTSWRRHETVVILTFAVLFSAGIFLFLLMISGGIFLAMLTALAVLVIISGVHYLIWGQRLDHSLFGQPRFEKAWTRGDYTLTFTPEDRSAKRSP